MEKKKLKHVSLLVLVIQNSALILTMRYTRASVPSDKLYLASTAVLMSEILKTLVCLVVIYHLLRRHRRLTFGQFLYRELFVQWKETMKLALPAILYLIQNNLQYVAATNLDAATFQVTYQFKILTTAFFTVVMLNRKLSSTKWAALGILTVGIGLVVLPGSAVKSQSETLGNQSNVQGLVSVFAACVLSGIAGVYFEKIVKAKTKQQVLLDDDTEIQLWVRNIQLSLFSVVLGCVFVLGLQDGKAILAYGFFQNYSVLTWIVIFIQAGGGLIVALVVKYADNILKGFATSISIIVSSLVSFWLFDFEPSLVFALGVLLVVYATYLYGSS